jgi:hypothetical protein
VCCLQVQFNAAAGQPQPMQAIVKAHNELSNTAQASIALNYPILTRLTHFSHMFTLLTEYRS